MITLPGVGLLVAELESALEFEGYTKGSDVFDQKLRERKVEKCREMKRMAVCSECPVYDECDLLKQYLGALR